MSTFAFNLSRPWFGLIRITVYAWQFACTLGLAMQVRRERRLLLGMDDRALKDVGFSRSDAQAEGSRSFWDLPIDRLRI